MPTWPSSQRTTKNCTSPLAPHLSHLTFAHGVPTIDGGQLTRITARLRPELGRWQQADRGSSTTPDLLNLAGPEITERWESLPLATRRWPATNRQSRASRCWETFGGQQLSVGFHCANMPFGLCAHSHTCWS